MRVNRLNFLVLITVALIVGLSTVYAADDSGKKQPKDTGTLSIRTTEAAYPVRIDGVDRGMTGVGTPAIYFLTPGMHKVEVLGPDGKTWSHDIEIRRGVKNCVCLKIVRTPVYGDCPYNFRLDGPEKVLEGDIITFSAINAGTAPVPIKYTWNVTNGSIVRGQGTPTITVDSNGLGGRTIDAELDVNDDVYDNKCRQVISVPTMVDSKPPLPTAYTCDEFYSKTADEDKARFDNCSIQVKNVPDAQFYIIINPGTDKLSTTRNTYERLSKRTRDYLVNERGIEAARISIFKGGAIDRTRYTLWIVPPGANPPVVK